MAEKINYTIEVNSKGAITSMKALESSANTSTSNMKRNFLALSNVVKGSVVLALAATALKLKSLATETINYGDRLHKLNLRLGVSVEQMDKLKQVAELSGVGFETLAMGMQRMTRRIEEATTGTGVAVSALEKLGIEANDIAAMAPEDQFKLIAEKLEEVSSQGEKVALAFKLFDSAGVSVLQMTKGLNVQLDGVKSSFSQKNVEAMALYNDNWTKFANTMTNLVIPPLTVILEAFNELVKLMDVLDGRETILPIEDQMAQLERKLVSQVKMYEKLGSTHTKVYKDLLLNLEQVRAAQGMGDTYTDQGDPNAGKENNQTLISTSSKSDKEYIDNWRLTEESKWEIKSRVLETLIQQDQEANDRMNALKLEGIEAGNNTELDMWQVKEREKYEVMSRFIQAQIDKEEELAAFKEKLRLEDLEYYRLEAEEASKNFEIIEEFGQDAAKTIADSMMGTFDQLVDGTLSFGDAFRKMTADILEDISKMILKQTILNALMGKNGSGGLMGGIFSGISSLFGDIGGGTAAGADILSNGAVINPSGAVWGMANGGVYPGGFKAFANGGKVTTPTIGLVGEGSMNEAIVPLPDGNSIPVKMTGVSGGGGSITVNNNIQIEASGDQQQDEVLAKRTAQLIETKIKEVIGQQKRYGGLLYQGV